MTIEELIEAYGHSMYQRGEYETDKKMKRHYHRLALKYLKEIKMLLVVIKGEVNDEIGKLD